MLFTVSTVKDSLSNVRRFVTGNLASGIDYMFVFLDADSPESQDFLESDSHVTCVRTDKTWWLGDRPASLNDRQSANANFVKTLLTNFVWADWLFHIDSDEVVHLDRPRLEELPYEIGNVRLAPLEGVSRRQWKGEVTNFKRLLEKDDLMLLKVLGVIARPNNNAYFHGHTIGKPGLRPRLDRWLGIHRVVDAERNTVDAYRADWLQVLHYESVSADEFVRKWTSIIASGPTVQVHPSREPMAHALRALARKGLSEKQARTYFTRIFERAIEDDFETLQDLNLLEVVDPHVVRYQPREFPPGARDHMNRVLVRLATESKDTFSPPRTEEAMAALDRARA